jgi:hypothetical protein
MPMGVERRVYEAIPPSRSSPQLLTIALTLLFATSVAVLLLQSGGLIFGHRAARASTAALAALAIATAALLALASPASAQGTARDPASRTRAPSRQPPR